MSADAWTPPARWQLGRTSTGVAGPVRTAALL
jgi:hypothetical protein